MHILKKAKRNYLLLFSVILLSILFIPVFDASASCFGIKHPQIELSFFDVIDSGEAKLEISVTQIDKDCIKEKYSSNKSYLPVKYELFLTDDELKSIVAHKTIINSESLVEKDRAGFTINYHEAYTEIPYCVFIISYWMEDKRELITEKCTY